jgi:hypothetical protein
MKLNYATPWDMSLLIFHLELIDPNKHFMSAELIIQVPKKTSV